MSTLCNHLQEKQDGSNSKNSLIFRLSLEKDVFIRERNTVQVQPLTIAEMEEQFNLIYSEKMIDNASSGRKAMEIETYTSNYVVEVVSYSNHRVFLKIGQQNSANTVALRDRNTLETEDVPMRTLQLLELFIVGSAY